MEDIRLTIMPTFKSVRKLMGFKESDNYDKNAVYKEQMSFANSRIIEDRDFFVIDKGYFGQIESEESLSLLKEEDMDEDLAYDNILKTDLEQGKYQFSARSKAIFIINTEFKFTDADQEAINRSICGEHYRGENNDGVYNEKIEGNDTVEQIFNLITNSAKKRFDYDSFSKGLENFDPDYIVFQIILSLASNESIELIIAKITSRFILSGYKLNENDLRDFIVQRKEDLGFEVLAIQMAGDSLNYGSDPLAVYLQIEDFLSKMQK